MDQHRGGIIIVEDDHSVTRAIARLLQAAGFQPRTFASSEALLVEEPSEQCADCFVIDMHLPGASGIDLYRKLRERGISAPVVIITAHDDPMHRRFATQIGAAAYITKPFSNRALLAAISSAIANDQRKRN
jgi:FixJ family two-component response regulator